MILVDRLTPAKRSVNMAKIPRAHTKPEMRVRQLLHAMGYRFRVQWKAAPGRPDIAFPGRQAAIFVHGCFWHQHPGCRFAYMPKTRTDFWRDKFERNQARDARDIARMAAEGWRSLVIWECETRDPEVLSERLREFLGPACMSQLRMSEEGLLP